MKSCFTRQSGNVNKSTVHPAQNRRSRGRSGLTLLEITIVIGILMALIGTGLYASGSIKRWRAGREAAEALRSVYSAQRMFLADNPTAQVSTITAAQIIPYLPNKATTMPTVAPLSGAALTIKVNVSPPVFLQGSNTYDPSGKPNDNLWDVGE